MQPEQPNPSTHDALTRSLYRLDTTPAQVWVEAQPLMQRQGGLRVLDDSTLEKPYAQQIALVSRHGGRVSTTRWSRDQSDHAAVD